MNIGLNQKHIPSIVSILKRILADENILFQTTKNAHWNVEGSDFMAMHTFFGDQYENLSDKIDDIAERIRTLGSAAPGTFSEILQNASLKESPIENNKATTFITLLLELHEAFIKNLRTDIEAIDNEYKDAGTADFLTGIMTDHEKMAWMLRAHLN